MITAERTSHINVGVNGYSWSLTEREALELRANLNKVLLDHSKDHAIELVKEICARQFNFAIADLEGPSRIARLANCRFAAMWLARKCGFSFNDIGLRLGGRDHGTVMHGCTVNQNRMSIDEKWRAMMVYLAGIVTERTGIPILLKTPKP
jgi:chromosomal replication initiation ATPase DnaA